MTIPRRTNGIRGQDGDAIILLNLLDDLEYRTYSNIGRAAFRSLPRRGFVHARLVPLDQLRGFSLLAASRSRPGTWRDAVAAVAALIAVVGASTVMEVAATAVGRRYAVADIVTGGLVLAVVTSLPNAVSAVYLARRGRGAAVLSTALNSNAINVVAGLLIPASLAGLGPGSGQDTLVAAWYTGLTVLALALAYRGRGLGRASGTAITAGYLAFVTALVITVEQGGVGPAAAVFPAAAVAGAGALLLTWPTQWRAVPAYPGGLWERESVLPGWSIGACGVSA